MYPAGPVPSEPRTLARPSWVIVAMISWSAAPESFSASDSSLRVMRPR